jgi:hypothetical protein
LTSPDHRHRGLLRIRRERPRRRAAEQPDELAPFHQQFLPCFEAEDSTAGVRDFEGAFVGYGSFASFPPSPVCPVRPKSGHSANARVYEYTP